MEWAAICRATVERDAIARFRLVERRLQIATSGHVNRDAAIRDLGDVHRHARTLGRRSRSWIADRAIRDRGGTGPARWLDPAPHHCETQNHRGRSDYDAMDAVVSHG